MQNIDFYIEQSANMENCSDGGSPAYNFDGVTLVKYRGTPDFDGREDAEIVMQIANEKNAMGVRTPKHLAVKRTTNGKSVNCWVLQERAKGNSFTYYCCSRNNTYLEQIQKQIILASVPNSHYEKLISDLCNLFDVGTELKSKNVFYDEDIQTGGFTIIDLLKLKDPKPFNPDSIQDVLYLLQSTAVLYNPSQAHSSRYKDITERNEIISKQLRSKILQNVFAAMEKVIPNFEQHRRWVLRTIPKYDLEYFANNGTYVGDLTLTDSECVQFDCMVQKILEDSIIKIETGKKLYWQVTTNEIRLDLERRGMQAAWLYSKVNTRNIEDFLTPPEDESYWNPQHEYGSACERDLQNILNHAFEERLDILAIDSKNPFVIQAKSELDKQRLLEAKMHSSKN